MLTLLALILLVILVVHTDTIDHFNTRVQKVLGVLAFFALVTVILGVFKWAAVILDAIIERQLYRIFWEAL